MDFDFVFQTLHLWRPYLWRAGCDKPDKERFKSGDQEPWIYRGGLLAEFRVGSVTCRGIVSQCVEMLVW